jgi:LysM repeat protein
MNSHRAMIVAVLVLGGGSLLAACGERQNVSTPTAPNAARPARAPITTHIVVQRGQSLRRIAQEYHVAERDIIAANHLAPPYTLKAGTILTIAVAVPKPTNQDKPAPKATRTARAPGKPDHESPAAKPARHTTVERSKPDVIPLDDAAAETTTTPAAARRKVSPQPGDADADQAR